MRLRIHSSLTPIRSAIGALATTVDGRLVPSAEIAALRVRGDGSITTGAVALVFFLLAITFIVLGIGNANGSTGTIKLGGYIGLVTAVVAWYASFAVVVNSTFGRVVLPVRPLAR